MMRNDWPRPLNRAIIFVARARVSEDVASYWISAYKHGHLSPFASADLQRTAFRDNAIERAAQANELWVRAAFNLLAWLA